MDEVKIVWVGVWVLPRPRSFEIALVQSLMKEGSDDM